MIRINITSVVLALVFSLMFVLLWMLQDELLEAHLNEAIYFFSSDGSEYLRLYKNFYSNDSLIENTDLFLIGSPILFMKLAGGDIFLVQAFNLLLMGVTLWFARKCFLTLAGRIAFIAGTLLFPYFLFGFLSLNKEVYAMCSAIFFASYISRGKLVFLIFSLLLALLARYYLFVALLILTVLLPSKTSPRYGWIFFLLIFFTMAAPISKYIIPGYSNEDLLDGAGALGFIFSKIIDNYGYALVYPIKYLALIPMRAYGFLNGSERTFDGTEAIVSVGSIFMVFFAFLIMRRKNHLDPIVLRLVVAGFIAPIPIMWSEIMHWRYYSFVYFFFLFAVVMHFVERRRLPFTK